MAMSLAGATRLAAWVTAINVIVATGFSVAGLVAPQAILPASFVPGDASLTFALYAAARTIPLALVAFAVIYKRSVPALIAVGLLAGIVQFCDAGVGLFQHDIGKTAGPLVIALVEFYAIYALAKASRS
jgi:pheromone shutdown protein TraB